MIMLHMDAGGVSQCQTLLIFIACRFCDTCAGAAGVFCINSDVWQACDMHKCMMQNDDGPS